MTANFTSLLALLMQASLAITKARIAGTPRFQAISPSSSPEFDPGGMKCPYPSPYTLPFHLHSEYRTRDLCAAKPVERTTINSEAAMTTTVRILTLGRIFYCAQWLQTICIYYISHQYTAINYPERRAVFSYRSARGWG